MSSPVLAALAIVLLPGLGSSCAAQDEPAIRIMETRSGARFGLFGPKPAAPAPTLFIFASSLETMAKQRIYTETGRQLTSRGWIYVAIEPPCHGADAKKDEPAELLGWAHRLKHGQDLMGPFVNRAVDVLNHLIAEGYVDPQRIAASGTSRGGFCALHFAAAEPRVRAVACVSPVTNLLTLREFKDVDPQRAREIGASRLADKLKDRALWISIGNHDDRVGTSDCLAAFEAFIAAARSAKPEPRILPLNLIIGPSEGHQAVADAYGSAAEFLHQAVGKPRP